MALHSQCKAFLDQIAAMGGPQLHELPPAQAREMALPPDLGGPEQPVFRVDNRTIPGPAGPIPVRVYAPAPGVLPALIYFHGGGFVIGNVDSSDRLCRSLANQSGCTVVSVDYRLSPEYKFPIAVQEAYAATQYVIEHAPEFQVDASRVAVGGDSAGGNLATVTALMARDKRRPTIAFQLLVYPLVDLDDDSPSMREFADGYFLSKNAMDYFTRHYLANAEESKQPFASPLASATLANLPPAFIITAECDPLRDQGETYAAKLREAGVRTTLKRYDGMIHPFLSLAGIVDGGREAIAEAATALKSALETYKSQVTS